MHNTLKQVLAVLHNTLQHLKHVANKRRHSVWQYSVW